MHDTRHRAQGTKGTSRRAQAQVTGREAQRTGYKAAAHGPAQGTGHSSCQLPNLSRLERPKPVLPLGFGACCDGPYGTIVEQRKDTVIYESVHQLPTVSIIRRQNGGRYTRQ